MTFNALWLKIKKALKINRGGIMPLLEMPVAIAPLKRARLLVQTTMNQP
jgi:hypothetical protein